MSRTRRPQAATRRVRVTVIIPCYNYGHFLPIAVRSALEQPGVDVEAIVIDDASPDGSAAVVSALAASDERVRAILHQRNRGHIVTYNEGLEQAEGDYVVLMSADDALAPGSLVRATALFEAEPSVGLVYGFPAEFTDAMPQARTRVRAWTVWTGHEWIERRCRTSRNCIMSPEVVMRRSVQDAIGGYDPGLPHSGDFEMWMRAAAVSDVGRVNGPTQGFYREHAQSMHSTRFASHLADLEGRLAAFEKVLAGPDARVHDAERLYAMARRALAVVALDHGRGALDSGGAPVEAIDDYKAFAARVWSDAPDLRTWRALQRRSATSPRTLARRVDAVVWRQVDDLKARLRWHRWRWTGV